ncbi:hypothetical protein MMC14_006058 [Varicellaria rhodocarpa]|nr:hypothetical protein [Varicellaria rhodocarpa]
MPRFFLRTSYVYTTQHYLHIHNEIDADYKQVGTLLTKLAIAPSEELQLVIIVVAKAIKKSPAIDAVKPVTSRGIVRILAQEVPVVLVEVLEDTPAGVGTLGVEAVKNVTNAVKLDILLVIVPKPVEQVATLEEVAMVVAMEAADVKVRLAILVADTVTCLVTVRKVKNATIVVNPVT